MFSVRIENSFTSRKIQKINNLKGLTKDDLIQWNNFGRKSMESFFDRIELLILSGPSNIGSSIFHKPNVNEFSNSENKEILRKIRSMVA